MAHGDSCCVAPRNCLVGSRQEGQDACSLEVEFEVKEPQLDSVLALEDMKLVQVLNDAHSRVFCMSMLDREF